MIAPKLSITHSQGYLDVVAMSPRVMHSYLTDWAERQRQAKQG